MYFQPYMFGNKTKERNGEIEIESLKRFHWGISLSNTLQVNVFKKCNNTNMKTN